MGVRGFLPPAFVCKLHKSSLELVVFWPSLGRSWLIQARPQCLVEELLASVFYKEKKDTLAYWKSSLIHGVPCNLRNKRRKPRRGSPTLGPPSGRWCPTPLKFLRGVGQGRAGRLSQCTTGVCTDVQGRTIVVLLPSSDRFGCKECRIHTTSSSPRMLYPTSSLQRTSDRGLEIFTVCMEQLA